MKRVPIHKEYDLMHEESNNTNLYNFKQLLEYFFLDNTSESIIIDQVINKADVENNLYLDKLLNLNNQRRAFFELGDYKSNSAYVKYKETLSLKFIPTSIEDSISEYLLSEDTFNKGYVTYKKQKQKLFKFLLKNCILSQDEIEEITTIKTSKEKSYLCLSKNPIDFLFCSTGQSYTSCLSLHSDYSGLVFLGLPGVMHDPNRLIAFITNGKYKKITVKDLDFKYFKMINRTWLLLLKTNDFYIVRRYPNSSYDYAHFLKKINLTTTSDPIESKFMFKLLHHVDSQPSMIYLDNLGIDIFAGEKCKYTRNGRTGALSTFNYADVSNGIESLYDENDLYRSCSSCENCGTRLYDEGEEYHLGDSIYCENCFSDFAGTCEYCEEDFYSEDLVYTENGYVCEWCLENSFTLCEECEEYVLNENIIKGETDQGYEICLCKTCCSDHFTICDECDVFIYKNECVSFESFTFCKTCAEEQLYLCTNCGKIDFINNLTNFNELLCENCKI